MNMSTVHGPMPRTFVSDSTISSSLIFSIAWSVGSSPASVRLARSRSAASLLADKPAARWVRSLVFEEIIPAIAYRVPEVAAFADQVWDRLRNPFVKHLLKNITLNHADKVRVRLVPTKAEYEKLFGVTPRRLAEALAQGAALA